MVIRNVMQLFSPVYCVILTSSPPPFDMRTLWQFFLVHFLSSCSFRPLPPPVPSFSPSVSPLGKEIKEEGIASHKSR